MRLIYLPTRSAASSSGRNSAHLIAAPALSWPLSAANSEASGAPAAPPSLYAPRPTRPPARAHVALRPSHAHSATETANSVARAQGQSRALESFKPSPPPAQAVASKMPSSGLELSPSYGTFGGPPNSVRRTPLGSLLARNSTTVAS